jgi:hypothetical protein
VLRIMESPVSDLYEETREIIAYIGHDRFLVCTFQLTSNRPVVECYGPIVCAVESVIK